MFRNSRTTPSPQTIELIRQLAIISGGALCGVTALYLEECRRRIQILQRVLDRRRAIIQVAQSRRYSTGVVAARSDTVDTEQVHSFDYSQHNWGGRAIADETPTLPPPDRSHDTTEPSNHHRVSRKQQYHPFGRPDYDHSSRQAVTPQQYSTTQLLKHETASISETHVAALLTRRQRLLPARASTRIHLQSPGQSERTDQIGSKSDTPVRKVASGATPEDVRTQYLHERVAPFGKEDHPNRGNVSVQAANALLPHVLYQGTLGDVINLCFWMLNNGAFTTDHGWRLVENCSRLAEADSPKKVFKFYRTFLNSPLYGALDPSETFSQKVKVLTLVLGWDLPVTRIEVGRSMLSKDYSSVGTETKVRIIGSACKHLLSDMQISRASDVLYFASRKAWKLDDPTRYLGLLPLADEVMMSAMADGDLHSYARILRWKRKCQLPEALKEQLNVLIEACGRKQSYQVLSQLILDGEHQFSTSQLLDLANDSNKAILAVTFAVNPQLIGRFESVYRLVPNQFRPYVHERGSIESLRATWKVARNLENTEAEALRLTTWLKETEDEESLRKLDEALLEIYLNANKFDKALECISRVHEEHQGGVRSFTHAARWFAKRWAWGGLERLLETSKQHAPFEFDENATKLFNGVIRLYSQAHKPTETWMFISTAIDELGFSPNFATVQVMLTSIVQHKSIDLVPRWLRFISAIGPIPVLTGPQAAHIVRQYYMCTRQPINHLFELCQRLITSVPWFHMGHFKSTLKIAIGHDLRYGSGSGDSVVVQQQALLRLKQMGEAVDIPNELQDRDQDTDDISTDVWRPTILNHDEAAELTPSHEESEKQFQQTVAAFHEEDRPIEPKDAYLSGKTVNYRKINEKEYSLRKRKSARRQPARDAGNMRLSTIDEDMSLKIALARYQEALDLYRESCDAVGLPKSVQTLKHAVDASIRLHEGDMSQAERLIAEAKNSGMDVHRAVETLLLHRSGALVIENSSEARRVSDATLEYYENRSREGDRMKPALVHTVANVLVARGYAQEALNLLASIFQSHDLIRVSPNTKSLSIWLKAYAQLSSIEGISWVVKRVLSGDFLIDSIFLHDMLKVANEHPNLRERARIRSWFNKCRAKRREQDLEAKIFGSQLVDCLVEYTQKFPRTGRPRRHNLDPDLHVVADGEDVDNSTFELSGVAHRVRKVKARPRSRLRIAQRRPSSIATRTSQEIPPGGRPMLGHGNEPTEWTTTGDDEWLTALESGRHRENSSVEGREVSSQTVQTGV